MPFCGMVRGKGSHMAQIVTRNEPWENRRKEAVAMINEWLKARDTAVQAAKQAGELARSRFGGQLDILYKGSMGDVVTEVDLIADRLIVDHLLKAYPEHRIYSEEAGEGGKASDWVWHVDPLDGTNNFAIGLPLYGVSISLSYQYQTVVGVVHDSAQGHTYSAVKGQGAWLEGARLQASPLGELSKSTISWIQGHGVAKQDTAALQLRHHLEQRLKRVLRVWAPTISWSMLARGQLHGIVLYNSVGEDLYSGLLLAREAGVKVTDFEGMEIGSQADMKPYLVAAVPEYHQQLLELVQEIQKEG
jgi:myo-inositol-1(or 4)-monophosphatase